MLKEKNDQYLSLTNKHIIMEKNFDIEKQQLLTIISKKENFLKTQTLEYNSKIKLLQEKHKSNVLKMKDREQEVLNLYKNLNNTIIEKMSEIQKEKNNTQKLIKEMSEKLLNEKKYITDQLENINIREQNIIKKENIYKKNIEDFAIKEINFEKNKVNQIEATNIKINLNDEDNILKNLDNSFIQVKKDIENIIELSFNDI